MRKIKIAGAGPSGLTAAINLARAGFWVEVFERRGDAAAGLVENIRDWKTGLPQ